MSKIADDSEAIARRLKELEADRQLALTGNTLEEKKEDPKEFDSCGMYMYGGQAANQYNALGAQYQQGNGMLSKHYQGGLEFLGRAKSNG